MSVSQELAATAAVMVAKGKGILAIDESFPSIKKRFDSIGIESTEENRRAYRELLITTPGGGEFVSGMILFDETIRQSTRSGERFVDALLRQGIMPGIKVDTGSKPLAGFSGEEVTEGLDNLRGRLAEYKDIGARFAKWRAVINIGTSFPTPGGIAANCHALARYAALCQEAGIVPMVEPEVMMDGSHTIERCYEVTEATLRALFTALIEQNVDLETTILKTSMVISGNECPTQAGIDEVAAATVRCLKSTVPASVPGIVFLSGGQSAEVATRHLNAMNANFPHKPWPLSYSYGRALQAPALKTWGGREENFAAAQAVLYRREKCNSAAALGTYSEALEAA
jgi:fructose-bisphosphate aldolase, class I